MNEEVVPLESLTGFIMDLPIGVEDGGVEMVCTGASQRNLKVISHS